MDEITDYEVDIILNELEYADKPNWEMCRYITYVTAQCNSTKKLKPSDILKFKWDNDKESADIEITNNDIERLKNKAEHYKEVLAKKKVKNNS